MAKKKTQPSSIHQDGKNLLINSLNAISEQLVASVYHKLAEQFKSSGGKISPKFNFYLTIYNKKDLLKSRLLNSKRQDNRVEEKEKVHMAFFEKHRARANEKGTIHRYTDHDKAISLLQIGYLTIIVSDDHIDAVKLCAAILATMYVLNKAGALMKAWGQFHDLKDFFLKEKDIYASSYIEQLEKVMSGQLGGHKDK
jgi:hypothetical protein